LHVCSSIVQLNRKQERPSHHCSACAHRYDRCRVIIPRCTKQRTLHRGTAQKRTPKKENTWKRTTKIGLPHSVTMLENLGVRKHTHESHTLAQTKFDVNSRTSSSMKKHAYIRIGGRNGGEEGKMVVFCWVLFDRLFCGFAHNYLLPSPLPPRTQPHPLPSTEATLLR
jgi:hypothetical protein